MDLREVKRWSTLRCEHCGHRFRWKRDYRFSFGNRDGKVYHESCIGYLTWRTTAAERLAIVGLVSELSGLTSRDVMVAAELRANDEDQRIADSNRVFRVFRDLDKAQEARS